MSNIVQFRELERATREDSDEVVVYEGVVAPEGVVAAQDTLFAYLYLNSKTYTLVWIGPNDFEFDVEQPYSFIKLQFSRLTQLQIDNLEVILPERRTTWKALARMQHFYYNKSIATLILNDGENRTLVEYDLLDNEKDRQEYLENVRSTEYQSRIAFARYDSEVIKVNGTEETQVNCCFTIERPQGTTESGWEFAISLPRVNLLRKRTLTWITKSHQAERLMHKLDFQESQAALAEKLGLHPKPVFADDIS